jgi:hypothetical protein
MGLSGKAWAMALPESAAQAVNKKISFLIPLVSPTLIL